jgi:hypothetical protein
VVAASAAPGTTQVMANLARFLLVGGALLIVAGALILLADRLGLRHLPGTLTWKRGNVTVVVPIGLMIVASIVLSLVLSLLFRR